MITMALPSWCRFLNFNQWRGLLAYQVDADKFYACTNATW